MTGADSGRDGSLPEDPEPQGAADRGTPLSLLQRAQARDPEAWRRLVQLYQPLLCFWCAREGLRGPDIEDVAQDVFAAAAAGLERFHRDRPGDTFRGWLRTITHNQVLQHVRRNQGQTRAEGGSDAWNQLQDVADPLPGPDADEAAEVSQLYRSALDQVRSEFEERTWQAFWRTAIESRSPTELADELGMSAAAIRQAKSRVLRRLKLEMGELLD